MSSFAYPDSKTRKIYGQVGKRIAHRIKTIVNKSLKQRTTNDAKP